MRHRGQLHEELVALDGGFLLRRVERELESDFDLSALALHAETLVGSD